MDERDGLKWKALNYSTEFFAQGRYGTYLIEKVRDGFYILCCKVHGNVYDSDWFQLMSSKRAAPLMQVAEIHDVANTR